MSCINMRSVVLIGVIFLSGYTVNASIIDGSVLDPVIENVVHLQASHPPSGVPGIWKKKTIWKARWVKEWKTATVVKPVWRKVWSPVEIREWVPIPKPPPDWNASSTPLEVIPPWNPMPYPDAEEATTIGPEEGYDYTKPTESEIEANETGYHYPKPGLNEHDVFETSSASPSHSDAWRSTDFSSFSQYSIDSPNPEPIRDHMQGSSNSLPVLSEFLEPPKFQGHSDAGVIEPSALIDEHHSTQAGHPSNKSTTLRPYQKEVSPYAVKLAQAVIQEKLNRSKNFTKNMNEQSIGLTQVVYRNDSASESSTAFPVYSASDSSSSLKSSKSFDPQEVTSASSVKVFVVTPVYPRDNEST